MVSSADTRSAAGSAIVGLIVAGAIGLTRMVGDLHRDVASAPASTRAKADSRLLRVRHLRGRPRGAHLVGGAPAPARCPMNAEVLRRLLRSPADIAGCCREGRDTRDIAITSLIAVVLGAAAFGGVIGSFRGGAQIAFAALKIALAPRGHARRCAPRPSTRSPLRLGRAWPLRSIIALVLAAAGRSSLVLLALSPALWLLFDLGLDYHAAALAAAVAYGIAGLAAIGILIRGLGPGAGRGLTAAAFIGIFFAVGGQSSWILRPYLVRPKTGTVPFLRAREGGFTDALRRSGRSAAGVYDRSSAEGEYYPSKIDDLGSIRAVPAIQEEE